MNPHRFWPLLHFRDLAEGDVYLRSFNSVRIYLIVSRSSGALPYSTISRNISARILILTSSFPLTFFLSFLSFLSVPFLLRISGAGVRRMRQMVGAVWLVHSWKFSSWRRDALEGALVCSTSIPGRRRRVTDTGRGKKRKRRSERVREK